MRVFSAFLNLQKFENPIDSSNNISKSFETLDPCKSKYLIPFIPFIFYNHGILIFDGEKFNCFVANYTIMA